MADNDDKMFPINRNSEHYKGDNEEIRAEQQEDHDKEKTQTQEGKQAITATGGE